MPHIKSLTGLLAHSILGRGDGARSPQLCTQTLAPVRAPGPRSRHTRAHASEETALHVTVHGQLQRQCKMQNDKKEIRSWLRDMIFYLKKFLLGEGVKNHLPCMQYAMQGNFP